jgi:hypothetical protein
MGINREQPHVFVLPEDRANSEIANGFLLDRDITPRITILKPSGGWHKLLLEFSSVHIRGMRKYGQRHFVLLIDFDDDFPNRMPQFTAAIPTELAARVFVVGAMREPEALKRELSMSYETIGQALAKDCRENTSQTWGHDHLRHNEPELNRLRQIVRPFLFA